METDILKAAKDVVHRWYKQRGTRIDLERAIVRMIRLVLRRSVRAK